MKEPNVLLDTLLEEAGISYSGLASRLNRLSAAAGRRTRYDHTAVAATGWSSSTARPHCGPPAAI